MPVQFPYPDNGWSTGKIRKVSDQTISQHKTELTDIAGQWSNGEISADEFGTAIGVKGWALIKIPGSPYTYAEGGPKNLELMVRDLKNGLAYMKEIGRGVLTLLDPRGQQHEIEIPIGEDPRNR